MHKEVQPFADIWANPPIDHAPGPVTRNLAAQSILHGAELLPKLEADAALLKEIRERTQAAHRRIYEAENHLYAVNKIWSAGSNDIEEARRLEDDRVIALARLRAAETKCEECRRAPSTASRRLASANNVELKIWRDALRWVDGAEKLFLVDDEEHSVEHARQWLQRRIGEILDRHNSSRPATVEIPLLALAITRKTFEMVRNDRFENESGRRPGVGGNPRRDYSGNQARTRELWCKHVCEETFANGLSQLSSARESHLAAGASVDSILRALTARAPEGQSELGAP